MKMHFINKKSSIGDMSYNRGFTLMETLIAIVILVTAITAPLTIAQSGLSLSRYAKDSLTASLLASEAIEYIRNKRDSNYLDNSGNWLSGHLQGYVSSGREFDVDVVDDKFINCNSGCDPLRYDATNYIYSHVVGNPSPFSRIITLSQVSPTEVQINVTVSWNSGSIVKDYQIVEHMYDWF